MTPHYVTVYQISAGEIQSFLTSARFGTAVFAIVALTFGFLALASVLILVFGKARLYRRKLLWLIPICLCAFGGLFAAATQPWLSNLNHGSDALQAYQKGEYQTVEGTVTHFDPMPYEGHKTECFSVQDKRFCYSDYLIAPGFRNTASHGGPIRSGLPVRIAYRTTGRHNTILRLEIAED